jgi:hypothetical protein
LEGLQEKKSQRVDEALALGLRTIDDVVKYLTEKIKPLFPDTYFNVRRDGFDPNSIVIRYISENDDILKKSNTAEFNAGVRMIIFVEGFNKDGSIGSMVEVRDSKLGYKNKQLKHFRAYKGDIDTAMEKLVKYFKDNSKIMSDKTLNAG